jgi:hypothetical protein
MLHTIPGAVRKQPLFPISMMTTAFAIALIFVMPAFGQGESAGGPTTASPEQPVALTAQAEGATVPRLVTFSGVLKDSSRKPATGTVTVAFSVYEFQEGGSPLWVETQAVQADAEGRYTVLLGATQPDGLPLDLFTTGKARWVGVQPQLPAAAEQPRVLLVGVPYALKAADADTLGGKPATAYVTTEALNAQGGAALPESASATSAGPQAPRMAVTGQAGKDASSGGPLTACAKVTADGTARANQLAKFTAPCTIHQSLIFDNGTNVGIGTSSPTAKLEVEEPNGSAIEGQVLATSGTTFGVLGLNASAGNDSAAVLGNALAKSGTTYGVKGVNSSSGQNAAGVEGENFATSGQTLGMVGFAESPTGTGTFAFASVESQTALGLLGCCSVGVWGDSGVGGTFGTSGVVGTADDGKGGTFANNSPSGFPTAFLFNSTSNHKSPVMEAAGKFGSCTTDTDGNLACTGTKSAVVPVDNGQRQVALYAVEAPQNWFEDFGGGQLASGAATITVDPTYAQTVDMASDYRVFLTPEGDCQGLYVSHKTAVGFEVHELGGGHSNVAFAYRIVALRRGYENVRLEDMTERLKNIKPPQPKPTPGPPLTLHPPPQG